MNSIGGNVFIELSGKNDWKSAKVINSRAITPSTTVAVTPHISCFFHKIVIFSRNENMSCFFRNYMKNTVYNLHIKKRNK